MQHNIVALVGVEWCHVGLLIRQSSRLHHSTV